MKLDVLKKIIKEEVKSAIQEELKDILLEALQAAKRPVQEPQSTYTPKVPASGERQKIRESYRNILGETAASFNSSHVSQPLRVTSTDTASPNGSLPEGEVSMDQIMGLMSAK